MSFEAAAPICDTNMTQPEQEWDRPQDIEWDYERLGLEPNDIGGFLSEQFNTARVRIQDSRSFFKDAARDSWLSKDQNDFLRRLAERRMRKLTAYEARHEDFSYQVPLAGQLDEGSRHALIDFSRNKSLLTLLYALESLISSKNGPADYDREDELLQASDHTLVASKVQTQRPNSPSGCTSAPVSDPHRHSMKPKSAECDVLQEGNRKRPRPIDEMDEGGYETAKRRRILPRKCMQPIEYAAPADKPTVQTACHDEENETDSLLRRTSLSSVSSTTSDTDSTSTGFSDHESCCCEDERPLVDEYNDKPSSTATAERVCKHGYVSRSSSTRLSCLKTGRIHRTECCASSNHPKEDEEYVQASHSHQPLPSNGKPTEVTMIEAGDMSIESNAIVR